ncbi:MULTISPECIES: ThuA domain-containing protein [Dyadobacter]|uniref:ThuA domain-containing protein n=1 Tax=Dyadobacter chenhuakuii TaxID=2909339 RepID=A0ABY4XRG6_9BACT|nr:MULTISPECIES: ThuA domain-containing protein [Dyadobacter]MCF2492724.1 ThuA domain-containing protein [Dyadobacter chenhuakuii]MCF2520787.1 ThuA domain-containing protein [Dyadobacter sp. CY351]USJ32985.1 ThuA domain-containing protein [Dyadobacter chenhuakuii]
MKRILKITLLLALVSGHIFAQKIVFIAGPDSHGKGEHEHQGGSTLLVKSIQEGLPGVNAVLLQSGWPKDSAVLNDADAIVIYADGGGDHLLIPHLAEMDRLTKKGIGLVMLHFSLEVPAGEVGNHVRDWIGGYFEINWSVNPVWEAAFSTFPDHPIANGVKPFSITDEWYYHMRFADGMENITPILQALPPESTLKGKDGTHSNNPGVREAVLTKKELQPVAWALERPDGGRGFGFSGGHMHKNWGNDNFRKIVLNAIAWTAKAKIPEQGIPSATPTEAALNALTKKLD